MPINVLAGEAPFPGTLHPDARGFESAERKEEPILEVDQIQGNILAGFNKDNQTLLFLRIVNVNHFKTWLAGVIPFIATTDEVWRFNRLFKQLRFRQRVETRTILAT
jgi:hypothetical protein